MMRKLSMLTLCLCFALGQLLAQSRTIIGKVTDANGNVIPNASVLIKGTRIGAATKSDGSYSITVPATAKTIVFSAVGMDPIEYSIGNKGVINTILTSNDKNLSEVIVVGYGTQQKKAFTGSATKVDTKEFSNLLGVSVDKQLAGRAAGVQVTNPGGLVNQPAVIRIRGVQSISQSNDPLYVIDGVPVISGNLAAATNSNTLGDINPDDIESMEILKDGSATAIYGSRAAGGVILITTKKGTKGKSKVNYSGFVGFSNPLKKFDLLNAKQFETITNEKLSNAGQTPTAGINASVDTANTDWQSAIMIKNAVSQSHTVSVQGGNDRTIYYFSLNYSDQKGILISNYNRAYRISANIEHEVNKFVKIGNKMNISRQEDGDQSNGFNSLGGAIAGALRLLPNVSPYNSANPTGYNIGYGNPGTTSNSNTMLPGPNGSTVDDNYYNIAYTIRNNKFYSDKYRIMDNAFLELSLAKGLKVRSQVGIDMLNDYSYQGNNPFHGDGYGSGGSNDNTESNYLRLVWSNYMNYNFSLGNHNFFLTAGNEAQKQTYKWFEATGSLLSDAFFEGYNVITNAQTTQTVGGNYTNTGFDSYFGRFNYDYKSKYFVQASIRRDGQSALAPGKKYGTFPGFSVGWRPSQEAFWQKSHFLNNAFNEFKLKGSYAKVGNTLSGFPYLSSYANNPYGNIAGINPSTVGNADLKWETSTKYDAGLELGILKNRITLGFDWFLNDVDNLVLSVPEPLSAGLTGNTSYDLNGGTISQNIGKLQNRGIELSLSATVVKTKDFSWDASINYSNVTNKITQLYSVGGVAVPFITNGNYNIIQTGNPINIIYGYKWAGVNVANGNPMFYKADNSIVQYNLTSGLGTVGTFYVANSKTDGTLGAKSSLTATDKSRLGVSAPTYFGGFTNNFNYKNFGLQIFLRYSGGNQIMNETRQDGLLNQKYQNNSTEILSRWTAAGQVTDVPKLYYGQDANVLQGSNSNSRFVENGDYIKLQNIVLSYTINSKMLAAKTNGYITGAKIYVQGQNLYTWSKYKGADPDNYSTLGVDAAVSPQVRTFSVGLSVGF